MKKQLSEMPRQELIKYSEKLYKHRQKDRKCDVKNLSYKKCKQCGKTMSLLDYFLGDVCLKCVERNHKKVVGQWHEKYKTN